MQWHNMKHVLTFVFTLMLTGWGLLHPAVCKADVYLVAVGIADYPGKDNDLRLCANDAKDLYDLYSKNSRTHAILLTNEEATVNNIERAMNTLYLQAKADDIVVFFFSGHGSPGKFEAYNIPLSYKRIRKAMSLSKSRHKMIFADACHSGKMRQGKSNSQQDQKAEVMLFLSSRDNEKSIENPRMLNGFFTTYLLKALKGNADTDKNRTITAKELFEYVSREVKRVSQDKQHPVMWGKFSDSMPVMRW